jgi:PAS domain S-box-containing protein
MSGSAKASVRNNEKTRIAGMRRDREQHFRAMFEGASIAICTCNLDGKILESNAALAKMLGHGGGELCGTYAPGLQTSDSQVGTLLSELKAGALKQEISFRRKDGSCFWGQLTVSAVHDADGNPSFLIAMLEDATESRRVAERSLAAEKMEVIGRLAGGIAHDFNNLLTGVLLYCDLLSAGIEPGSRLLQHVQEIRLAGEQGAALTQQLLAIARKQVPQPRPVLVNEVVSSTENLLRRLIGEQIELVTILAPDLRTVLADEAQLRQVLLNLVLNARDAMPHGGRITVSTRANHHFSGADPGVSLLVEDNGCGMDDDTRAHLFEPFFTT